jgi:hypothetical protein
MQHILLTALSIYVLEAKKNLNENKRQSYVSLQKKKPTQRQKDVIQGELAAVTFDLYNELHEFSGEIYQTPPQLRSVSNKILGDRT